MARCLLGVLVVTVGLVALSSTTWETRSSLRQTTPLRGTRLRETEAVTASGISRTLLRPMPAFDLRFSLN